MAYQSTKSYGHELGLSCCFRQWRATSHCNKFHGYALSFKLVFETDQLDECNWVQDFGSLKPVKHFLERTFDHKLVIARDDPHLNALSEMFVNTETADVLVLSAVGCEAFAEYVATFVNLWLSTGCPQDMSEADMELLDEASHYPAKRPAHTLPHFARVRLVSVECREHAANSAVFICPRF
jgi:6-pyruvoyltetrahydropterin/6-carboxytetrahydropterin synthase